MELHLFQSVYGLSQWETMLHCNIVSHWLRPYRITLWCRTAHQCFNEGSKKQYHENATVVSLLHQPINLSLGNVILVDINYITNKVPYQLIKSQQLIWKSCTRIFHLWLPDLQIRCCDLTIWEGNRIVTPAISARQHDPFVNVDDTHNIYICTTHGSLFAGCDEFIFEFKRIKK